MFGGYRGSSCGVERMIRGSLFTAHSKFTIPKLFWASGKFFLSAAFKVPRDQLGGQPRSTDSARIAEPIPPKICKVQMPSASPMQTNDDNTTNCSIESSTIAEMKPCNGSVARRAVRRSLLIHLSALSRQSPPWMGLDFLAPSLNAAAIRHYTKNIHTGQSVSSKGFKVAGPVDDTIYAVSTAPGRAGIAIIRISGPGCLDVCDPS